MKIALMFLLLPLSANASFLCDGRKMISNDGALYNFASDQQCQDALQNATNGFTCDGRRLITMRGNSYSFSSDQQCADAVKYSK